jgi:selenide,water dikinase
MARLNRVGAEMMQKYKAHAATDVTGFGILGHANNLASNQKAKVSLRIHTLPIIKGMKEVNDVVPFKLLLGYSAETSGGLFVCLPKENAQKFIDEIQQIEKLPAWIVGEVIAGDNTAHIIDKPTILEI